MKTGSGTVRVCPVVSSMNCNCSGPAATSVLPDTSSGRRNVALVVSSFGLAPLCSATQISAGPGLRRSMYTRDCCVRPAADGVMVDGTGVETGTPTLAGGCVDSEPVVGETVD